MHTSDTNTIYPVFQASQFETDVLVGSPSVDINQLMRTWVQKQDKHWPQDSLSAEFILNNVNCIYGSHWIVSAESSGDWSASIGTPHYRTVTCSSCNGKKRSQNSNNDWIECYSCKGHGTVEKKKPFGTVNKAKRMGVLTMSLFKIFRTKQISIVVNNSFQIC